MNSLSPQDARLARSIEILEHDQAFPHDSIEIEPLHESELATHRLFEREQGEWIEPTYWPEMTLSPKRVQKLIEQRDWTKRKQKKSDNEPAYSTIDAKYLEPLDKSVYRRWYREGIAAGKDPEVMLCDWLKANSNCNPEVGNLLCEVAEEFKKPPPEQHGFFTIMRTSHRRAKCSQIRSHHRLLWRCN